MPLIGAVMMPHPPILVPAVGRGQEKQGETSIQGMREAARFVARQKPDVIVVVTPHAAAFQDAVAVMDCDSLSGNFNAFGAPDTTMHLRIDRELSGELVKAMEEEGVTAVVLDEASCRFYGVNQVLDHGGMVPLHYIEEEMSDFRAVYVAAGGLSVRQHYRSGMALGKLAEKRKERILVLASADMSHCLKQDGPYGFRDEGLRWEQMAGKALTEGRPQDLLTADSHLTEAAAQCGLRPLAFALGSLDARALGITVYSHEWPFGVGYMAASFRPEGETDSLWPVLDGEENTLPHKEEEDDYQKLARASVESFTRKGKLLSFQSIASQLNEASVDRMKATHLGAFVTLHKDGQLRGCIGTLEPVYGNVGEEIIRNAVSACSQDPRFDPVEEEELAELDIEVSVLQPLEKIDSTDQLDPEKYGVVVEKGRRRGVLLPAIEGVDTVEQQVSIACSKAGIANREGMTLYRFEVEHHG